MSNPYATVMVSYYFNHYVILVHVYSVPFDITVREKKHSEEFVNIFLWYKNQGIINFLHSLKFRYFFYVESFSELNLFMFAYWKQWNLSELFRLCLNFWKVQWNVMLLKLDFFHNFSVGWFWRGSHSEKICKWRTMQFCFFVSFLFISFLRC